MFMRSNSFPVKVNYTTYETNEELYNMLKNSVYSYMQEQFVKIQADK